MANEVLANEVLAPRADVTLSEADYRAFCGALEASARGRTFLAEYARRNRHANTEMLLAALDRLEAQVARQAATTEADRIRQELRALLAALRAAQPTIDAGAAAIKAAKLAALLGFVQQRIESIIANASSALPAEVAALVMPDEAAAEAARAQFAVVPRAEQPELPIPSPQTAATRPIALVPEPVQSPSEPQSNASEPIALALEPARRSVAIMPEISLFDSAPVKSIVSPPRCGEGLGVVAGPVAVETVIETTIELPQAAVAEEAIAVTPIAQPEPIEPMPADDPLALIMALSEAERTALFT